MSVSVDQPSSMGASDEGAEEVLDEEPYSPESYDDGYIDDPDETEDD